MEVSQQVWIITLGIAAAVLLFDVIVIARNPHEPTMKECAVALAIYISGALLFAGYIFASYGKDDSGESYGLQFLTGWLVEYSLSVDNLFVFIVLLGALNVPRKYQQEALMVGIILAILMRGLFIAVGYQLVERFTWVFYIFGFFLIYTAYGLIKSYRDHEEESPEENRIVKFAQQRLNVGDEWHGLKLWYRKNGTRVVAPMAIVILALALTDIMFALDSIPAIFGITQEPYLVVMANVFALMGLRQLYFLLGGLLKRLVFLSIGLSFILAWIGAKLIIHAAYKGGLLDWEIPTLLSLAVVIVTLVVTAVASLWKTRGDQPEAAGTASH